MVTKLVAGACVVALAVLSESHVAEGARCGPHAVALRLSAPLAVGDDSGHASFACAIGGTRLRFAAAWSGRAAHTRLGVALVAE